MKKTAKTLVAISILMISLQVITVGNPDILAKVYCKVQIHLAKVIPSDSRNIIVVLTDDINRMVAAPQLFCYGNNTYDFTESNSVNRTRGVQLISTEVTFENMPAEMTSIIDLAPITPAVADFEDDVDVITVDLSSLAPVTPDEATFEDMPSEMASIIDLAPTTPAVADFEDDIDVITVDLSSSAPVTPDEADFE